MDTEHRYLQLHVESRTNNPATMEITYHKEPPMEDQPDTPMDSLLDAAEATGRAIVRYLVLAACLLVLAALLAGCAAAMGEREDTRREVVARLTGTKADAFFLTNGPASRQYTATSGMTVYDWTTHPPGALPLARPLCTITLTADQAGTIVAVRIVNDAVGFRRPSACDEVLR